VTGAKIRRAGSSGLDSLTPSERRIVELATGPAGSHLLPPEALRAALERRGFAAETWEVGPDALARAAAEAAALAKGPVPRVDLALLMPEYDARTAGLARNLAEQRIAPVQAVLHRSL
jgi:hypothetical protein